jgi:hypothetical protein
MYLEEFIEKYQPIEKEDESILFETYGEDKIMVDSFPVYKVWSLVEGDYNQLFLLPGFHRVNLLNYVLTKNSWENSDIIVNYDDMVSVEKVKAVTIEYIEEKLGIVLDDDKVLELIEFLNNKLI